MSWKTFEHSEALIKAGVLPPLFALLKCPQTNGAQSATQTLLNICADGITGMEKRYHVSEECAIAPIIQIEPPNLNRVNFQ